MKRTRIAARETAARKLPPGPAADEERLFRDAMASFPSGVTVVTTVDPDGRWTGFTATSFCSASLNPPLVLVCLARTARCHTVFASAQSWVVHIVHPGQTDLALRFAIRGADKFADADFVTNPSGMPVLERSCVSLTCRAHASYPAGDHTILLGRVERTQLGGMSPVVYFRRRFHTFTTSTDYLIEPQPWQG